MKANSDASFVFPAFLTMVETQQNSHVKAVRYDNAPELKFTELFATKEIVSFYSCPETPQQNSVVKKKHQHILNVARSLMFQSNIPLDQWDDCVMIAVFLINRMPTHVLENKTP